MADTALANTTAQLSGKTVLTAEGDWTITGLHTFSRGAAVPFAVAAGALNVTNLDADKLDGQDGSYYLTATNLNAGTAPTARLGSGVASATTFLRGDQTWAVAGVLVGYAATLANVLNTAAETTILTFDIPASDWADGDLITIELVSLEKNNKGSGGTALVKINAGAGAQVTIVAAAVFNNSATEYRNRRVIRLARQGADVYVHAGDDAGRADWSQAQDNAIINLKGPSTPTNFTSTFTVSLKVTLSAADATFYIKPQSARIWRQKAT